jgi:hypothetical protein
VSRNPYDIFNANPQHRELLLDDADEVEKPQFIEVETNCILDLRKNLVCTLLAMEIKKVNGKPTPIGIINRQLDGKPAVIIHLGDFSLWVTSSFAEGGLLLPCMKEAPEHLSHIYTSNKIDLSDF